MAFAAIETGMQQADVEGSPLSRNKPRRKIFINVLGSKTAPMNRNRQLIQPYGFDLAGRENPHINGVIKGFGHSVGGIMVLDCVASGTVWIDMETLGVDVLVSAPQKGWSSSPCAGLVMLSERARELIEDTTSSSFAIDLKKWLQIMETYESGAHAYHATMPTDALAKFRDAMVETKEYGFKKVCEDQKELGRRVRAMFAEKGFRSVAAEGFQAPSVVVSFTDNPDIQTGKRFAAEGLQIAAGVPLMCDEPEDYRSFRIGLFGLDKLQNIDRTVDNLEQALTQLLAKTNTR